MIAAAIQIIASTLLYFHPIPNSNASFPAFSHADHKQLTNITFMLVSKSNIIIPESAPRFYICHIFAPDYFKFCHNQSLCSHPQITDIRFVIEYTTLYLST